MRRVRWAVGEGSEVVVGGGSEAGSGCGGWVGEEGLAAEEEVEVESVVIVGWGVASVFGYRRRERRREEV